MMQSELEDLCFAILHPDCYQKLHEERNKLWSLEPATAVGHTSTSLDDVLSVLPTCSVHSSTSYACMV